MQAGPDSADILAFAFLLAAWTGYTLLADHRFAGHGLMGVTADATQAAGGRVVGIIPQALVDPRPGYSRDGECRVRRGAVRGRRAVQPGIRLG